MTLTTPRAGALRLSLVLIGLLGAAPLMAQQPAAPPEMETLAPEMDVSESFQQFFSGLWAPQDRYANGPHVREAFRPAVAQVREATVEVRHNGRRIAYGGIVGPDGWIITKASELDGHVTCRLKSTREFDAKIVGIDSEYDLAMLKIDAKNLPTLDLSGTNPPKRAERTQTVAIKPAAEQSDEQQEEPSADASAALSAAAAGDLQPGDWLATVGLSQSPVSVGVVSVLPRPIEKSPGFLGVQIDLQYEPTNGRPAGVRIESVTDKGGAKQAGVLPGDVVTAIEDKPTRTPQELKEAISDRNPGDRVELSVAREEEQLRIVATLHEWDPNPAERRAHYQNRLGGKLSERRFGFPAALQHDTVLTADECGGPVVDLDGRVVAFNIARAGRTESYALPVEAVRSRLFDLMSGRLAPIGEAN